MKPMLAHKFNDHKHKLTYPLYVQPKLNGIRALYKDGIFQSRDEVLWHPSVLAHIQTELTAVIPPHFLLDGELYLHGLSLQRINGAASVIRKEPCELTSSIHYHIFDIVSTTQPDLPFSERAKLLYHFRQLFTVNQILNSHIVPTSFVYQTEAEELYKHYRESGYEGLMYRIPERPYGYSWECGNKQNRWTSLLKRKDWQDDEFEIVDFQVTTGEKGFRGFQLTCITKESKEFNVGSGMCAGEVDFYTANSPVGKQARVRYEMLSDSLIPLKPTLEAIL